MHVRRIVTGVDEEGRSVFVDDGRPPRTHVFVHTPGLEFSLVWGTDAAARPAVDGADPTPQLGRPLPRSADSTRLILMQVPAGSADLGHAEEAIAEQRAVWPDLLGHFEADDTPGFHRTHAIDYLVLLDGELVLELDDGAETTVRRGDLVVQHATRHAWRNRTDRPATFVAALIGRPSAADEHS